MALLSKAKQVKRRDIHPRAAGPGPRRRPQQKKVRQRNAKHPRLVPDRGDDPRGHRRPAAPQKEPPERPAVGVELDADRVEGAHVNDRVSCTDQEARLLFLDLAGGGDERDELAEAHNDLNAILFTKRSFCGSQQAR